MIYESYPWKKELVKHRKTLTKFSKKKMAIYKDRSYFKIEKAILFSAFIIRKLIDCPGKVSDDVDNYRLNVQSIPAIERIDVFNRFVDNDTHDWENAVSETVDARKVCNWLIHSFLLKLVENEGGKGIFGFAVSSDYDKSKKLYIIEIKDWIEYIRFVETDNIATLHMKFDERTGDRVYTKKERGNMVE